MLIFIFGGRSDADRSPFRLTEVVYWATRLPKGVCYLQERREIVGALVNQYIDIACDDCGKIVPANLAHRRNVKVKSGSTEWNSPTEINGQRSVHHNSVAHYSHHSLRLCDECELSRRRADSFRFWSIVVAIVVVVGLLFLSSGGQPDQPGPAVPATEMEGLATVPADMPTELEPALADQGSGIQEQLPSVPYNEADPASLSRTDQPAEKPTPLTGSETSSDANAKPAKAKSSNDRAITRIRARDSGG